MQGGGRQSPLRQASPVLEVTQSAAAEPAEGEKNEGKKNKIRIKLAGFFNFETTSWYCLE